ncbi:hypothetical protein [Paenibacillus sp. Soil522]|uniref:hypothetical protein n=1 Tax=Paenibacillus sp. Soil522 TaxID=1736388 RepID=UPI00138F056F|nr:hypothetical protein [Paenibacillus sp. Soil522]
MKQHEIECYRICFYLLQSEKMARETAKDALIKLFKQEMFFASEMGARTELLRKQSIKSALEAKVSMSGGD